MTILGESVRCTVCTVRHKQAAAIRVGRTPLPRKDEYFLRAARSQGRTCSPAGNTLQQAGIGFASGHPLLRQLPEKLESVAECMALGHRKARQRDHILGSSKDVDHDSRPASESSTTDGECIHRVVAQSRHERHECAAKEHMNLGAASFSVRSLVEAMDSTVFTVQSMGLLFSRTIRTGRA